MDRLTSVSAIQYHQWSHLDSQASVYCMWACDVWCGRIVETSGSDVKVMAVDAEHSLLHINPTARRALYNPNRDKAVIANGTHTFLLSWRFDEYD